MCISDIVVIHSPFPINLSDLRPKPKNVPLLSEIKYSLFASEKEKQKYINKISSF